MEKQNSRTFRFGKIGIIIGILLFVMSIIWVAKAVISGNEQSGDDVTWVG